MSDGDTLAALRLGLPDYTWAHSRGRFIGSRAPSGDLAAATLVVAFDVRNANIRYAHAPKERWKTGPNGLHDKVLRLRRYVEKDAIRVRESVAGLRRVAASLDGMTLPARMVP